MIFESKNEIIHSKLDEETIIRRVDELLYTSLRILGKVEKFDELLDELKTKTTDFWWLRTHYNINILNPFNPQLELINVKSLVQKKIYIYIFVRRAENAQNSVLFNFRVQKIGDRRSILTIFRLNSKLIWNDLEIDEAFKSMHQSVIKKIWNLDIEEWIVKTTMEHSSNK